MRVQNSVAAVRAFASESELGSNSIELRTPVDELLNAVGTFFDEDASGVFVDEAVARVDGVLQVKADLIFIAKRDGDPALRVLRGGFGQLLLREHEHAAGFRESDGSTESGDARADDDEISFGWDIRQAFLG